MNTPSFPAIHEIDGLAGSLADLAVRTSAEGPWRSGAFAALARSGLLAAFIPAERGGTAAAEAGLVVALVAVAERCLTTALALTQWAAAVRIIAAGPTDVQQELLPPLARGDALTTVGISQLTTSRRHLGRPALAATRDGEAWRLDGICPWVTGADSTQTIVTGAATDDGGQMFFIVPTDALGLSIDPPLQMLGLTGSRTSVVRFAGVRPSHALPPPASGGVRTGGLSTTALAVGSTRASVGVIAREAQARAGLGPVAADFTAEIAAVESRLMTAAASGIEPADRDRLRADSNSLVVRAAQAALTATKGAGYVTGHPVERLVRESLFFLVWSCPQAVTDAFLCDLTAG